MTGDARPTDATSAPKILLSPPEVHPSDVAAVVEAMESGWIAPAGPALAAFENDLIAFTGADAALALSSGSAALHLALLVVGVEPGDEVIVQTTTFAASAFAVCHAGALPVFCDVDDATGMLDPDLLAELLFERAAQGRLPAAVMPVDLYGMCADYERIRVVCDQYDVPVVQDAAEALGSYAQDRAGGTHGTLGALSFNGNKIITTSGGGALLGPEDLLDRARKLSTQAREPVPHYEHAAIGFNYRMSNILAALGRSQLARLDRRIAARQQVQDAYRERLPELDWMPHGVTERPNHWLSVALLPDGVPPEHVVESLDAVGIEARRSWMPMHRQPVFIERGDLVVGGEVAERFYARGLCLPSSQALTGDDIDRICDAVAAAIDAL